VGGTGRGEPLGCMRMVSDAVDVILL
jgi:hypothetical protein